ncbi:MAG TPA: acetoacetate decarboxylase family protein [Acidimicrobiales bacterium]|jgi:hypothetical protein
MNQTYEFDGGTVTMPVEVRDAAAATAMFDVDATYAATLVPPAFDVVQTAPGRTDLSIGCIDYVDNDLGDYLEVGIIFFVRPAAGPTDGSANGTFIWKLPVDQQFTCDAGEGIWGFPKTVERITASSSDDSWTWRLDMDGQHVFTVTLPAGGDDDMGDMDMTTYTMRNGVPHATVFSQGGPSSAVRIGGDGVSIELGSHPIAKDLAALGLPAGATMSTYTGHMHGRFEAPERL